MTTQPCLARLCDWKRTHESFAPRFKVAYLQLCNGTRVKGEALCEDCLKRPKASLEDIKSSKYMYGLITDPIPVTAKVYGSTFYKRMLEITGATPSSAWLLRAEQIEKAIASRIQQATEEGDIEVLKCMEEETDMPPKKKVILTPLPKAQTLMRTFTPIRTVYLESAEQPKVLETESQGIWKQELGGEKCWVAESGHVFLDYDGVIGEFLGILNKDGELVAAE